MTAAILIDIRVGSPHFRDHLPLRQGDLKRLRWGLTLRDPMDCSPPGSSVHGILQARILEWVATAFSSIMRKISRGREQEREDGVEKRLRGCQEVGR